MQKKSLCQQLMTSVGKAEHGWKRGGFISNLLTRSYKTMKFRHPVVIVAEQGDECKTPASWTGTLATITDAPHQKRVWGGKCLAPLATKQQSTSKSREGACSHPTSPFSSPDLSNLPSLITPAVSLGTAEGCCGSETLVRNTLIA